MKKLIGLLLGTAFLAGQNPIARISTSQGDIDVELLADTAPGTVQNFLRYVNRGAYNNTIFHRLVAGFVLQGGGYRWQSGPVKLPADGPIQNEYRLSNLRGTLAMAKLGGDPNSATNEFFFNLADNSGNLNNQNGGFTVFARVRDVAGLDVMDRLARAATGTVGGLEDFPLVNFTGGSVQESNLLLIKEITVPNRAVVSASGIITASAFGGLSSAAPGSFIEIYGSGFSEVTRGWAESDFRAGRAPTSLEGVSVTIGGIPGYVNYVSPTQINAQLPTGVFPGNSVNVILNLRGQTVNTTFRIANRAPGLLAPAAFKSGDKQYVAAVRPDGSLVSNGSVPGLAAAPAVPGETLIFYGTGFGPVSPPSISIAGQIVNGTTTLIAPVEFKFGELAGRVTFAGLAPGLVGVYQFNVVVPEDIARSDVPLNVTVDGTAIEQKLLLPVRE